MNLTRENGQNWITIGGVIFFECLGDWQWVKDRVSRIFSLWYPFEDSFEDNFEREKFRKKIWKKSESASVSSNESDE